MCDERTEPTVVWPLPGKGRPGGVGLRSRETGREGAGERVTGAAAGEPGEARSGTRSPGPFSHAAPASRSRPPAPPLPSPGRRNLSHQSPGTLNNGRGR